MTDLDRTFRDADRMLVADLWPEIVTRTPGPLPPTSPARRVTTIVVALIIAVVGIGLAIRVFTYDTSMPANPTPTVTTSTEPQAMRRGVSIVGLDRSIQELGGLPARLPELDMSTDGTRVAYVQHGAIVTASTDGGQVRTLTDPSLLRRAAVPSWSPSGQQIAFLAGPALDQLYVMNADGGNLTRLATSASWTSAGPSWSPDGTQLVYPTGEHGGIAVVDARGGTPTVLPFTGSDPAWGPDGGIASTVWHSDGSSSLVISDPDGSHRRVISIPNAVRGGSDGALSWSPDGRSIAFDMFCEQSPPGLAVVNVATGAVRELVQPCGGHEASSRSYLSDSMRMSGSSWMPSGDAVLLSVW